MEKRLGTACQKHERPNKRKLCLDVFSKRPDKIVPTLITNESPSVFSMYNHFTVKKKSTGWDNYSVASGSTVKLGNKERFDKEQIGIKEPFPVTNLSFTS